VDHESGDPTCDGCGKVFWKQEDGVSWALVMKLSKNDFCFDSGRWTDGNAFQQDNYMLDETYPNHAQWDAKSLAFHKLEADAIKLQVRINGHGSPQSFNDAPMVEFTDSSTPEKLMTTHDVKIVKHPDWNTWMRSFGNARQRAPALMVGGKFIIDPQPPCRNNLNTGNQHQPSGCGKQCMFCFNAGDGGGCPTSGGANDVNIGIGQNRNYCGGGDGNKCSSSGNWIGNSQTFVWARAKSSAAALRVSGCQADAWNGQYSLKEGSTNHWLLDDTHEVYRLAATQKWRLSDYVSVTSENKYAEQCPESAATSDPTDASYSNGCIVIPAAPVSCQSAADCDAGGLTGALCDLNNNVCVVASSWSRKPGFQIEEGLDSVAASDCFGSLNEAQQACNGDCTGVVSAQNVCPDPEKIHRITHGTPTLKDETEDLGNCQIAYVKSSC
jgi:hypothetical protein